jgi:hypothetical protein
VLKGTIEEVSNLDASNLQADEALLDTHTPYDCYIQAIQGIYVNIYNSGNIYYSQEPSDYKLTGVVRGSGKLLKKIKGPPIRRTPLYSNMQLESTT